MNTIDIIKERYHQQQPDNGALQALQQNAFEAFNKWGIPTVRHEEWKYTRIASLFNREFAFSPAASPATIKGSDLEAFRLPGHDEANVLVFVNGRYDAGLSTIRSEALTILSLREAADSYGDIIETHLGHSSRYLRDGIHALNTAFVQDGMFVQVKKGKRVEHPVFIYHLTDARAGYVFAQPRVLLHIGANAEIQVVETAATMGMTDSFTNGVMEVVVETDARVEYYKIQNDVPTTSQVSTTHFRQIGKSYVHTVTISLNGGIVRNNLNVALEAERAEAHLYGLYFVKGHSHIDNHTVVDNVKPNCLSNELYKGVLDDHSTAVFNGKIYVQPDAQKTNAFQSNKNILLSDASGVNTKPQLEIFADDVKCSHGCTVGQLDEEGMFYLRSRGVREKVARSLLVHAFALDILEHIKPEPLRKYVDQLITERLEFEMI